MFDGIQLQYLLAGGPLDLVDAAPRAVGFVYGVVVLNVNVTVLL